MKSYLEMLVRYTIGHAADERESVNMYIGESLKQRTGDTIVEQVSKNIDYVIDGRHIDNEFSTVY